MGGTGEYIFTNEAQEEEKEFTIDDRLSPERRKRNKQRQSGYDTAQRQHSSNYAGQNEFKGTGLLPAINQNNNTF